MIDKLTKIIPIGSVLLVVIGFLKLKIFYLLFNINISSFINISDVISSFIEDSIFIVYTLMFYFYYLIQNTKNSEAVNEENIRSDERIKVYNKLLQDQKKLKEKLEKTLKNNESQSNFDEIEATKAKTNYQYKKYFRIIFALIISFLFIYCFSTPQTKYSTDFYIFAAVVSPSLFVKIFEKSVFDTYYYEAIIVLSIITIIGALTNKEYYNVKYDNKFSNYVIKMNNQIIKCDKFNYYVGKTESYFFIYNSKLDESTAYKTDNIIYINLKK